MITPLLLRFLQVQTETSHILLLLIDYRVFGLVLRRKVSSEITVQILPLNKPASQNTITPLEKETKELVLSLNMFMEKNKHFGSVQPKIPIVSVQPGRP